MNKKASTKSRVRSKSITKKRTTKPKLMIGLIYANWCGHCQSLKPEWETMKHDLIEKSEVQPYQIIEIEESDEDKEQKMNSINRRLIGDKLKSDGYPTIFKINNDRIEYYEGGRTAKDIKEWFGGKIRAEKKNEPIVRTWANKLFGGFSSGTLSRKSRRKN